MGAASTRPPSSTTEGPNVSGTQLSAMGTVMALGTALALFPLAVTARSCVMPWHQTHLASDGTVGVLLMSSQWEQVSVIQGGVDSSRMEPL